MRRLLLSALLAAAGAACDGGRTVTPPSPRTSPDAGRRAGDAQTTDTLPPPDSAGWDDAQAGVDAGLPDARQIDAGARHPDATPDSGCQGSECPPCGAGFTLAAGLCQPDSPEPFRSRRPSEVCGKWRREHQDVVPEWSPTPGSSDACDPGSVPSAAQDNGIRRSNLYRWLVGLAPVRLDPSVLANEQACAVVQQAQGHLDHHPTSAAPCYTAAAAAGAGSSNLALGTGLADSVDLYVSDNNVDSLGHRRWVLNAQGEVTGFGFKPSAGCMFAFSTSGQAMVPFVAWPPPGYVPVQAAEGILSLASNDFAPIAGTRVELAVGEGAAQPVTFSHLADGYGWGTVIAFSAPPGSWTAGSTLRVAVLGTSGGDLRYTVHFIDCP